MKRHWSTLAVILAFSLTASAQHHGRYNSTAGGAIPQGTQVQIRMIDSLSSATAKAGQTFRATLEQPIVVNGRTLYPRGAEVTGQVLQAKSSGRLSAPGELQLVLTQISANGATFPIAVEPLMMKGESHAKSNATKIGGGAAAGAIIGAIAGGGKGAAIGAGVGAAAGTGVAAATGKKDTMIASEAVLGFMTAAPPPGSMEQPYTSASQRERGRYGSAPEQSYDDPHGQRYGSSPEFSENERNTIRSCMSGQYGSLPPGLAKRDRLPPGLERQVQRNGQLPPGLQKRVQPLPGVCASRLPQLPADWSRVILGDRVLLLDRAQRIKDLFSLNE
ncbi:MAG: hypothetical protein ACRD3E_11125 [Terriglobales bacterium]